MQSELVSFIYRNSRQDDFSDITYVLILNCYFHYSRSAGSFSNRKKCRSREEDSWTFVPIVYCKVYSTLQRKLHLYIPFLGIARPQKQISTFMCL